MGNCPKCKCPARIKVGIKQNKQYYECKACGKNYSRNTKRIKVKCLHCESTKTHKNGKRWDGKQSYKCSSCKKQFVLDKSDRFISSRTF